MPCKSHVTRHTLTCAVCLVSMLLGARTLAAEPPAEPLAPAASTGRTEPVPMPTLGGKQFWADELFFRGWRIQRNAMADHYRLLDPTNCRRTSGTFDECRARLDEIKRQEKLPPMQGRAVVVLHGLMRSRGSMAKLCKYLEKEGGFTVVNVSYPSTRRSIADHARSLSRLIENLDGIEEINFVAHSMGNIVIRRYLGDTIDPATGRPRDRRLKRMVMLGPPNQGSEIASALAGNALFAALDGAPGQELGARWNAIKDKLATPPFEFGVIAGGRGDDKGYNPLLPGDDDGTVSVASTKLPGQKDSIVLPVLHSFMMKDPRVMEHTLRFLKEGRFRPAEVTTER
jgi:pimeloyl-ACP methyl ester carboxylesterase